MRLLAGLLIALTTAHAGDAEVLSAPAVEARLARLRPVTEEVLGRPIPGEIRIEVMPCDRWVELETAAEVKRRSSIEGDKRGAELEEDCREDAQMQVMGFLAIAEDSIRLIDEHFDLFTGAQVRDVLDLVLVHEMVHVFQRRVLGSGSPSAPPEARAAYAALLEGHAEYVTRRVAVRLGHDAAFHLLARRHAIERPAQETLSDLVSDVWLIFQYGDGERFFIALADRLGYAEAERRAFASPPRTISEINWPPDYLSGVCSDAGRVLTDAVVALVGARDEQVYPSPPAVMRRLLAPAGPAVSAQAMHGYRATWAATPEIRYGALAGRPARLEVTNAVSPEAAARLFAALGRAVRAEGEELIAPGALWQVFWDAHEDTEVDGAPMLRSSRVVRKRNDVSRRNVESFMLLHDHRIVRLLVEMPPEGREHLDRLARRVLALMRGESQAGVLNGVPEQRFLALVAPESPAPGCLEKLVRDPDLDVRATALARATHLAVVRRALEDPSLRAQAARALRRYAEAEPLLVALLDDADPRVRENAMTALAEFGWVKRVGDAELTARLEDPDPGVRRALLALAAKAEAVPRAQRRAVLMAYTEDAAAPVRLAAWTHLEAMENDTLIPAGVWRRGLEDPNGAVRECVFDAVRLGGYRSGGPFPAEEAAQRLVAALHDHNPNIRRSASWRLTSLAAQLEPFLADLIAALRCEDTRPDIVETLGKMGAKARAALPSLLALVEVRAVRRQVIEALGRIGHRHDAVEAVLLEALDDHDGGVRLAALCALDRIGAGVPDPLRIIVPVLEHGGTWDRVAAAEKLGERKGARAKAALLRALDDPSSQVRRPAMKALLAVDSTAETVVAVSRMLLDSDAWLRECTRWELECLGDAAAPAIPMVMRAMEAEPDDIGEFYEILENVGPAAREALPVLRKLRQHEQEGVRKEAQEAIDRIEAKWE